MKYNTQNLTDRRNYGIDFLRIICMMMIPILHTLGHGGILSVSVPLSIHNNVAWLLEIASYCAVNCYALISGYVGYGRNQKYSNIIYLYFQVIFYTIVTTIIFLFYKPEMVGLKTVILAIVPFAYGTYWYFTAYFCLFFFIPFLNAMIEKFDKRTIQKMLMMAFAMFSLLPTVFHSDFGKTNWGYSFLWLAILYIAGAYIKKYDINVAKNRYNIYCYFLCVFITWLSRIVIEILTKKIFGEPKGGGYLITYTSPTIIVCAISLLLFFANMQCGQKLIKFIRFFAPASFGVYLFHEEPLIRDTFMNNAFVDYLSFNPLIMILAVIGTALCIWLSGSLVDRCRIMIFKVLKIKVLSNWIEKKFSILITSLCCWINGKLSL